MSLPIRETPILKGKDAEKFLQEINRERTPEEKARLRESYLRAMRVWDEMKKKGKII